MKRHGSDLDPELEAFLKPRRIRRRVSSAMRMRALDQARAYLAGGALPLARPPEARPIPLARGRRLLRLALAASFAVGGIAVGAVAGLAVGAAAAHYSRRAHISPVVAPGRLPPASGVAVASVGGASTEAPTPTHEAATLPHPAGRGAKSDPFTAELELLQRALGAYTRHDFSVALTIVAAHAHRFPTGQLAEQREALRVRSLAGAGRADEAHRAAAAFAVRFPRSVLLPRVAGGAESPQP